MLTSERVTRPRALGASTMGEAFQITAAPSSLAMLEFFAAIGIPICEEGGCPS